VITLGDHPVITIRSGLARFFGRSKLSGWGSGLSGCFLRTCDLDSRAIGADESLINGPNSPVLGVETGQNGPEIDQNVSKIDQTGLVASGDESRLVVRCSSGYHGWVQGLAERLGLNVTQTVSQGLLRLAEASGYCYSMPTRGRRLPVMPRLEDWFWAPLFWGWPSMGWLHPPASSSRSGRGLLELDGGQQQRSGRR
jgi:hypothetical protein